MAGRERQFRFGIPIDPGGGIAEALAAVFPPRTGAPDNIVPTEFPFSPFCGPPRFPARPLSDFGREKPFPRQALRIAEPHPNEMEHFMKQDAAVLGRILFQFGVEDDQTFANECRGMGRIPGGIAKTGGVANFDGATYQQHAWQALLSISPRKPLIPREPYCPPSVPQCAAGLTRGEGGVSVFSG